MVPEVFDMNVMGLLNSFIHLGGFHPLPVRYLMMMCRAGALKDRKQFL